MGRVVSATQARIHFGELMRRVMETGEPTVVERAGEPVVAIIPLDEYERFLEAQKQQVDWKELVARARAQIRSELGEREMMPPEELIRQMREERDAQILGLR